jgi:hypothetical protein
VLVISLDTFSNDACVSKRITPSKDHLTGAMVLFFRHKFMKNMWQMGGGVMYVWLHNVSLKLIVNIGFSKEYFFGIKSDVNLLCFPLYSQ